MFTTPRRHAKRVATALAGASLVLGGLSLTALAPSASAGTINPTVHCTLPAGQGEATGPQSMQVDLDKTEAAPGATVHAVVTLGLGPAKSTISLSNVPTTPSIEMAMSGGATGDVTVTGATTNIDTVNGQPVQLPVFEGDFIIPNTAQGMVDLTPVSVITKTVVLGSTYNTPCDVVSGGGSIGSINVQGAGSDQPTLVAPSGTVRPGYTLGFSGVGWPANAANPTVTVCPTAGGTCVVDPISNNTIAVNALGELSGSAKLTTTGVPDGTYTVTVDAGGKQASATITVQAFVQSGDRVMTMSPNSGPVGTAVSLEGSNWSPNTAVTVQGLRADGGLAGNRTVVVTTPDGNLSGQYTVTDPATTQVRAREGVSNTKAVILPFSVSTIVPTVSSVFPDTYPGGTIAVTGKNWPAGSPTASLCDTSGNNCNAAAISSANLTVAADGTLSGTVTVASSAAKANYLLKLSNGGSYATVPLVVQQRWADVTSHSVGPLGNIWCGVVGHDFTPWSKITLTGVDANGNYTSDASVAVADWDGDWGAAILVADNDTVALVAYESSNPSLRATFSVPGL